MSERGRLTIKDDGTTVEDADFELHRWTSERRNYMTHGARPLCRPEQSEWQRLRNRIQELERKLRERGLP